MQFVGVLILVAGYASVYTAVRMVKRPAGGQSGSVLYWLTGIDSLGAPSGSAHSSTATPAQSGSGAPNTPPSRLTGGGSRGFH